MGLIESSLWVLMNVQFSSNYCYFSGKIQIFNRSSDNPWKYQTSIRQRYPTEIGRAPTKINGQ